MNATTLGEIRASAAARDLTDDKMQQVRELLYGEFKRESDARVALLENRVRELESGLHRRLDLIQARLDALVGEMTADRKTAFDDLARHVVELGERIRRGNLKD
ncbi:MAG TPA: hypothetical protein PK264_21010 [Hyphomicrobiaceae bacterium]|nr:hypothetical protein [Hyphomicrobiaceae bacterium]